MPLSLYRRGQIWHYRGTVAGRRLRGSCKTADRNTAARLAAEREAREWKRHLDGPASVLTFAQAASLYLDAGKPARFLAKVAAYWRDTLVRDVTPGAVRQAAIDLYPSHSAATRNRQAIVPTQAVINHAAELELCPSLKMRRFKVERREKVPATWDWVQAFMASARPNLAALACFLFLTGARISEATALTWDEVDLAGARALIRQTKIGAERWAHLPPVLVSAIANIPTRSGRVFGYVSRISAGPQWDKAIARAGLPHRSFHTCRHGFATAMLHAGVDPVTVAKRGGWKTPAHVFATYGHAVEDATITDRIVGTGTAVTQRGRRRPKP